MYGLVIYIYGFFMHRFTICTYTYTGFSHICVLHNIPKWDAAKFTRLQGGSNWSSVPRLKRQCGLSLNVAWDYHGVICVMAIIVVNSG